MFLALLSVTLLASVAASAIVARIFKKPIDKILERRNEIVVQMRDCLGECPDQDRILPRPT